MPNYIIDGEQLQLISDRVSLEEKWNNLNDQDKSFVVEFLQATTDNKTINESNWMNTLGDIVGIFDPTGVVDLVNGVSYISQGDNLFGFLSIVSALPYAGDLVAKPVMGALKVGAPSAKALDGVLTATKTAKSADEIADLAKQLKNLSDQGGITGKFIKGVGFIGDKIKSTIQRLPGTPMSGVKNTILQWIDLFERATKTGKAARTNVGKLAQEYSKVGAKKGLQDLDKSRLSALLSQEIQTIKGLEGAFTGYRTPNKLFSWKNVYGGVPQAMGRNKSVRSLMRKTKWWAGFLDWMGWGNFVGPEEVEAKLGSKEEMVRQMEKYNQTENAKKYYSEEFGDKEQSKQSEPQKQEPKKSGGALDDLFSSVLGPLKLV